MSDSLCLLSLDGGGVRGLSSLAILKRLMEAVNSESPPKPCEYFDMIGGTSTGGILAILLGRLEMDIDECIQIYTELSSSIFRKQRHRVTIRGQLQGRFDTEELERSMKNIVAEKEGSEDALLKNPGTSACKVFVCATSEETSDNVTFSTYPPRGSSHLYSTARIWEAARATSAASSFFDPIPIGPFGEVFVDGATGANNPIRQLWNEAKFVWEDNPLEANIKCIVSIGTGMPSLTAFGGNLVDVGQTLLQIATETEKTAESFHREHSELAIENRYFRFNVLHGLENVGLEDAAQLKKIMAATGRYVASEAVHRQIRLCGERLATRESSFSWPSNSSAIGLECLQSLCYPQMNERRQDIRPALSDTCTWLLKHPKSQTWLRQGGLIWIKGKPGAGKSTLMRHALERFEDGTSGQDHTIISFFFHGRGSTLQKTQAGLFRSLLEQLSLKTGSLLPDLVTAFERRQKSRGTSGTAWHWHAEELQRFTEVTILHITKDRKVTLFIDALDECGEDVALELIEFFEQLKEKRSRFSICFSCRHYPVIFLNDGLDICVDDYNRDDISHFVQTKLKPCIKFPQISEDDLHDLRGIVNDNSSGLFQWVVLVTSLICKRCRDGWSPKKIQKELQNVPRDLHGVYDQILDRIEIEYRSVALRLMQWVLFAKYPMELSNIRYAMASNKDPLTCESIQSWKASDGYIETDEQMEQLIRSLSGGLIEVKHHVFPHSPDRTPVEFIHQSVIDFLMHGGLDKLESNELFGLSTAIGRGHHMLARSCINFITLEEHYTESHWMEEKYSNLSFMNYAVSRLFYHVEQAEIEGCPQKYLIPRLQRPSDSVLFRDLRYIHFGDYYEIFDKFDEYNDYSVFEANDGSIEYKKEEESEKTIVNSIMESRYGIGHEYGYSILHQAAFYRSTTVTRLLLESGADVNAQSYEGIHPLHILGILEEDDESSNLSEEVATLLLNYDADIEGRDNSGRTALHTAASFGSSKIALLLLKAGADIHAICYNERTALHYSTEAEMALFLLEMGADVNAKDCLGVTPLQFASFSRLNSDTVRVLCEYGADRRMRSKNGRVALHYAAVYGDEVSVELLLHHATDTVNFEDHFGKTPLHLAIEMKNLGIAGLLLKNGANVAAKTKDGQTVLHQAAAGQGEWFIIGLIDSMSSFCEHEHMMIFTDEEFLNTKDKDGCTALHLATIHRLSRFSWLLLRLGADVKDKNEVETIRNYLEGSKLRVIRPRNRRAYRGRRRQPKGVGRRKIENGMRLVLLMVNGEIPEWLSE